MPDNATPLAITAEQFAGLTPDSQAILNAQLAKSGFSEQQRNGLKAPSPAAAPNVQVPAVTNLPGGDVQRVVPSDGLTLVQRLSGFRTLLKFTSDKEAVIASAERAGISREQLGAEPADPAAMAAQQREADVADAFAPPADATGYKLHYDPQFAQARDTAELASLDAEYKSAFHHAGVPTALAQPLLDAILETGEQYASKSMTEGGRALRWAEEGAMFRKASANSADDIRLATLGYHSLPAKFREQLDASFSLHSARAQIQLAALGRALEYRTSKGSSK